MKKILFSVMLLFTAIFTAIFTMQARALSTVENYNTLDQIEISGDVATLDNRLVAVESVTKQTVAMCGSTYPGLNSQAMVTGHVDVAASDEVGWRVKVVS